MLRKIAATLAVVGVLAGLGAFGALSTFESHAVVDPNAFSTGTVVINTDHDDEALFTVSNMAPGDQKTLPLTVTNNGSLELRYAVESVADDPDNKGLRNQLDLTIKDGVTTCTDGGFATDGNIDYATGDLGGDVATPLQLIGDKAAGQDDGDLVLDAKGGDDDSEVLCFNVKLPLTTPDDYQDARTTATFKFWAEQTKNNP